MWAGARIDLGERRKLRLRVAVVARRTHFFVPDCPLPIVSLPDGVRRFGMRPNTAQPCGEVQHTIRQGHVWPAERERRRAGGGRRRHAGDRGGCRMNLVCVIAATNAPPPRKRPPPKVSVSEPRAQPTLCGPREAAPHAGKWSHGSSGSVAPSAIARPAAHSSPLEAVRTAKRVLAPGFCQSERTQAKP